MTKNAEPAYQVFPGVTGATYIRKGKVGDWKNLLTPEMNERFEAEFVAKVKEHGLEFEFEWAIHVVDLLLIFSSVENKWKRLHKLCDECSG